MSPSDFRQKVRPGDYVEVLCSGPGRGYKGYVGDVFEDRFELLIVTNAFEHFSNLSAEAKTLTRLFYFKDVDDVQSTL
ncbi:MAG TPA: hypothetical protein VHM70_01815 [Polyangiaceae bacterium]|nr:hypothetical protein [Polyangiaceae bacterium]